MAKNLNEAEIKTLDCTIDELVKHLDLDGILDSLLAKGLVSAESHSKLNKMLQNGERVVAIRKVISEDLKLNPPGFLDKFIMILKNNERTKYLGDIVAEG